VIYAFFLIYLLYLYNYHLISLKIFPLKSSFNDIIEKNNCNISVNNIINVLNINLKYKVIYTCSFIFVLKELIRFSLIFISPFKVYNKNF